MNLTGLIPPQYKALAIGIAVAAVIAVAFGAGCAVTGWRKDADIADLKREKAEAEAKESQQAFSNLAAAIKRIKDVADSANIDVSALGRKLDAISKEQKNVKPLPVDCRLDPDRLRNLAEAAAAVNESAFGLKPSRSLQANPSP